ncbi:hypothetical protein CUT44_30160 [Streptomyces carminius]|uniref:Uncharacterized protein n=1 Tax=Streptomyces carminius TaxID=2665496 RepID=A0A2M8LR96_9ACTN|nr:DUF5956 family protein [Streptomyces carminius]PJE94480.1 hypothetical protein CUT44_30160 [Streptomyces carminius]
MTAQTWSEFPQVGEPPPAGGGVYESPRGQRYIELPETGRGALLAWVAGPRRVVRSPAGLADKPPVVTAVTTGEGETEHSESPRTVVDQEEIDAAVDEYLTEADLPPRPRGWRWFLALPPSCSGPEDFHRSVAALLGDEPADLRPADLRKALENDGGELLAPA